MGGSKTSTTTSSPYAPAQPDLQMAATAAKDAYNSTYQPGTNVAGLNSNITDGWDAATANANSGATTNLANQGMSAVNSLQQNGGLSGLQQIGAGAIGGSMGYLNGQGSSVNDNLTRYANGSQLDPQSNPYFAQSLQNAIGQAAKGVNDQFTSSGRFGSGAQADALGTSLGRIATDANSQQYNQNVNQQFQAANAIDSGNLARANFGMSSGNALAGIGQQGVANNFQGINSIGSLNQAQNMDANNMLNIGGQQQQYQQQLIDDKNQSPWTRVGNLTNIGTAIGGMGGTQINTQKTNPGAAGYIGMGLSALGTAKNLFSDERLKENIEPVGKLNDGQNVYSYNYKGDNKPQIGLLAQEVAQNMPDAVSRHESGYLMVNYDKATAKARGAK